MWLRSAQLGLADQKTTIAESHELEQGKRVRVDASRLTFHHQIRHGHMGRNARRSDVAIESALTARIDR